MSWCWSYPFFDTLYYNFPAWYFYNYYYYPVYSPYPYGPIYYGSARNAPKPASLNHKRKNETVNINKIKNQVINTLKQLVNSDNELGAYLREIEEMKLFQENYDHELLSLEEMEIVFKGKQKLMADNKNNVDSQNDFPFPPRNATIDYLSESGRNDNDLFPPNGDNFYL